MRARIIEQLAKESNHTVEQIERTISLRESGATVPFIAAYRKEKTGSLEEKEIQNLEYRYRALVELEKKKASIFHIIQKTHKISDELQKKIEQSFVRTELEDLYLRYRPENKIKEETELDEKLEPLVIALEEQSITTGSIEDLAGAYTGKKTDIDTVEEVLERTVQIFASRITNNSEVRNLVRVYLLQKGTLISEKNTSYSKKKKLAKYEAYFNFSAPITSLQTHKIMVIKRGIEEDILKVKLSVNEDLLFKEIEKLIITNQESIGTEFLRNSIARAFSTLLLPGLEKEIWFHLKEKAEHEVIDQLGDNLRKLLLAPPFGARRVLGIDPGFKSGCRMAVVDEQGNLLKSANVFPHDPQKEVKETQQMILDWIKEFSIEAIVIGDGTASRETDHIIKEALRESKSNEIISLVISEVGANNYASSKVGKEDLPDVDDHIKAAVSIARRFQDPMKELVKIDARALCQGQFHHDVSQVQLRKKLRQIMEWCVAKIGVNINTASRESVSQIPGISESLAKRIVKYRSENGLFKRRSEMLKVPHFGKKAYNQIAGFVRIIDGDNPLDQTLIHPEKYKLIEKIASNHELQINDLFKNEQFWENFNSEAFVNNSTNSPTFEMIVFEMLHPGVDIRPPFKKISFNEGISSLKDIKPGMVLKGRVSNVTDFGAFVDIGVHQDGLVHISEISTNYVKEAHRVLSVGDIIEVQVLKIDFEKNRISLSMKALESKTYSYQKKKKKKKKKKRIPPPPQPQQDLKNKKMPNLEDLVKHFNRLG